MKSQGFVNLVDHRQTNFARRPIGQAFADDLRAAIRHGGRFGLKQRAKYGVFLPAIKRRQRIKLAFDRPVGTDHRVGSTHQPDAHHALKQVSAL
jgi:hypothetical protein